MTRVIMPKLGVNIDHIATLRQARGTRYPSPVEGALVAQRAGADGITLHLREDRRHIQVDDVWAIQAAIDVPLNFEMAPTADMLAFALKLKPEKVCLVPERREERTTEGGLNLTQNTEELLALIGSLLHSGIEVSLFIEPQIEAILQAIKLGVSCIELHTGAYAEAKGEQVSLLLDQIVQAAEFAHQKGLKVNAGHGLNRHNLKPLTLCPVIEEYNIGHSLIADGIFMGLSEAVKQFKRLIG
jgi:pyridoxine 5-phosphate synthase